MVEMNFENRWKQRFANFQKATGQLTEFIEKEELNKFELQGLIQAFEYTFELGWKTMKDYLEEEGLSVRSPRETIKIAFQTRLIIDGHTWIEALNMRNLMAHTYDEQKASEAEELIRTKYYAIMKELCLKMEKFL